AMRRAKYRHDATITSSTMRARSRTNASIGSFARKRSFSDASAAASAALNVASGFGPPSAAVRASRSSGSTAEGGPPVDSSGVDMSAPLVSRAERQHLVTVLGHEHRVLPLGGQGMILRHDRPAVGEELRVPAAGVDHRLDGDRHAGHELDARAGL